MIPEERENHETINREQQDDAQVLDASDMERRDDTNISSGDTDRGGEADAADLIPQDTPDLVETMNGMVASGRIDNGAFSGEQNDDDEESMLGNLDERDPHEAGMSIVEDDEPL